MKLLKVFLPTGSVAYYDPPQDMPSDPIGRRVLVPSGDGHVTGVVAGLGKGKPKGEALYFVDDSPVVGRDEIVFVYQCAKDYLLSPAKVFSFLFPSAFFWKRKSVVKVNIKNLKGLDAFSASVVEHVRSKHQVSLSSLEKKFGKAPIKELIKKGILKVEERWVAPEPKKEVFLSLAVNLEEALSRIKKAQKKLLIETVATRKVVKKDDLIEIGFSSQDINDLLRRGILKETDPVFSEKERKEFPKVEGSFSFGQSAFFQGSLEESLGLLELLCKEEISQGRSVKVLVSHTDLIPTVKASLENAFGDSTLEINSSLTPKRLLTNWFRASEHPSVVVGSLIGLLCPQKDLSSIVLFDESSPAVRIRHFRGMDLRRLTLLRAKVSSLKVFFFGPVPSVSSYHFFSSKGGLIGSMPSSETVVLKVNSNTIVEEGLFKKLQREEGRILFLVSKKGYSHLFCDRCSLMAICPKCGGILTYFASEGKVRCKRCGFFSQEVLCPSCGLPLREAGFGVERVQEELKKLLKKDFLVSNYPYWFLSADVVVVLSADPILSIPSYDSEERFFLYIQRARRLAKRKIYIQTTLPTEYVKNFLEEDFYRSELERRRIENLPPFSRVVFLRIKDEDTARQIVDSFSPKAVLRQKGREFLVMIKISLRSSAEELRKLLWEKSKSIIDISFDEPR